MIRTAWISTTGRPSATDGSITSAGSTVKAKAPAARARKTQNGGQIQGECDQEIRSGFCKGCILNISMIRRPAYLPVPIFITGNPKHPSISAINGFSPQFGTFLSQYFRKDNFYDHNGAFQQTDLNQGYQSLDTSFGGEISYDVFDGLTLDDKFRISKIDGSFVGIYPATVEDAPTLATAIGGAGATLRYATGPLAGTSIAQSRRAGR